MLWKGGGTVSAKGTVSALSACMGGVELTDARIVAIMAASSQAEDSKAPRGQASQRQRKLDRWIKAQQPTEESNVVMDWPGPAGMI